RRSSRASTAACGTSYPGRTGPCTSRRATATAAAIPAPGTTGSCGLSKVPPCIRFLLHLMELAEVVGHLAGLRRFAVRSLGGESPDEALVFGSGLVGDRIYDLFDEEQGVPLTSKNAPFLLRYRVRYLDPMVRGGDLEPWLRVRMPDGQETLLSDRRGIGEGSARRGRAPGLRGA